MKKFKVFVLLTAILAIFALPALAQVDPDFPFELNDAIVAGIMTVFGLGLMAIVNLVKTGIKKLIPNYDKWPKVSRHALMYVVTAAIAAGATAFVLIQMKVWAMDRFILYTIYTWGYINQFWKALKGVIGKAK